MRVSKKVLVACEFSGVVRDAFLRRGHDAWSCDVLDGRRPTRGRHYKQDVRPLLKEKWDLVIAHPPCTYLTKCGAPARQKDESRRDKMMLGIEFFMECLGANSPRVAVENPVPFKEVTEAVGRCTQTIHPWQFGHLITKPTCLWLKGLPELESTDVVEPINNIMDVIHNPKTRRWMRSITFLGIAEAMAEQWGSLR